MAMYLLTELHFKYTVFFSCVFTELLSFVYKIDEMLFESTSKFTSKIEINEIFPWTEIK